MTPAVAIEGVSHCYGTRQALNDVTFSITPSTFAVLLGLNGAGKSTLFSLITRLYAVQHGHIRISAAMSDMPRAKPCAWSVSYSNNETLDLDKVTCAYRGLL
jgi:ABC-type multidrug transport system ATPase subunit